MKRARLVVVVFVVVLSAGTGLLAAEGGLRIAGFSAHTFPTLQFGWPVAKWLVDHYVSDRDVLWVPQDYRAKLDAARAHPPAVVFLGDSCTEFGEYPAMTTQRLQQLSPEIATGVKLGVAGWSTVQGLVQLQRDVLPLAPRIVTIYYGWNDHWRALGPSDPDSRTTAAGFWLSQHVRLYQLWMKARLVTTVPRDVAKRPFRVPLPLYEANLKEMARLIQDRGGRAVFITAPSGHERGKEPQYLLQQFVARAPELVPLHASYVEATRRAAAATGAVLCDAAQNFAGLPDKARYFQKDGVHLSHAGDERLADLVSRCVVEASTTTDNGKADNSRP